MRIAVIVTTYNRPDALAAVLAGFGAQTDRDFEVLVADDGSDTGTRQAVADAAQRAPFALTHVWQEDRGFRAAAIRNRAVAKTTAPYVVFTDGDCIPPRSFVRRHRLLAERGRFVAGNRILLSEEFSRRVITEHIPIHRWGNLPWFRAWLRRDANRLAPLLRFSPQAIFRNAYPQRWIGVKTCNLAVWREDLVRVNGLDESYEGWGLEDSDLVIRLLHAGVRHKSARFFASVFHLWHPDSDRSKLPVNEARLKALLAGAETQASRGIDQYLSRAGT